MRPPEYMAKGGAILRRIREDLGFSTREVERRSGIVVRQRKYRDYFVSHTYLSNLEKGAAYPHLLKLETLGNIYWRSTIVLVSLFGFSSHDPSPEDARLALPKTSLVTPLSATEDTGESIYAPMRLQENVDLGSTSLVSRMFKDWAQIPVALLQRLDLHNSLYGYVGAHDYTLFPLIRPGSFVQIDPRQRRIATSWKGEFERPVYFLELREGYACCWCEIQDRQLMILSTPQSGLKSRSVRYPGDVEVIGRVIAVTMRIADITSVAR
jgi:transcriptional regulator with XRE-family HTH domain